MYLLKLGMMLVLEAILKQFVTKAVFPRGVTCHLMATVGPKQPQQNAPSSGNRTQGFVHPKDHSAAELHPLLYFESTHLLRLILNLRQHQTCSPPASACSVARVTNLDHSVQFRVFSSYSLHPCHSPGCGSVWLSVTVHTQFVRYMGSS